MEEREKESFFPKKLPQRQEGAGFVIQGKQKLLGKRRKLVLRGNLAELRKQKIGDAIGSQNGNQKEGRQGFAGKKEKKDATPYSLKKSFGGRTPTRESVAVHSPLP